MVLNVPRMQATVRPDLPSIPRVVIVDADRRVLQSLADLLGVDGEVDVVGRAGDVRAALEEIERVKPDAVLVDPRLPDVDAGIALIGGLTRAWPSIRIVVTGWGGGSEARTVLNGSTCYVSKGSPPEEFVEAILAGCRD
jgi:two-component system, NarL family, response regulator DesR